MNRIIYLHGFASGPTSKKATFFKTKFAEQGVNIEVPDLAEGDFENLTLTGQLRVIERLANGEPVSLIGSSLGGYLAALYASKHTEVRKVVLMAPAFDFVNGWTERLGEQVMHQWKTTGKLAIEHYGDGRTHQLNYHLIEDASKYDPYPSFKQRALIFHGSQDDVVPPARSTTFVETHPNAELTTLNSNHELVDALEPIWQRTRSFIVA